jgi:hypothetical protein
VPSSSLELSDKMSCLLLAASGALFCPTSWGSSSRTTPSMLLPQHTKSSPHTPKVKSITPQVKSKLCSFYVEPEDAKFCQLLISGREEAIRPQLLISSGTPVSYERDPPVGGWVLVEVISFNDMVYNLDFA